MESGWVRFFVHAGIALVLGIFNFVIFFNTPIRNYNDSILILIFMVLMFIGIFLFTISFDFMQDSDHDVLRKIISVLGLLVVLFCGLVMTITLACIERETITELGPWLLATMTMWTFGGLLTYFIYRIVDAFCPPEGVYPFIPLAAFVVSYFLHVFWNVLDRAAGGFFYLWTDFLIYALLLGLLIFLKVHSGKSIGLSSAFRKDNRQTKHVAGNPAKAVKYEHASQEEAETKRSSDFYDFNSAYKKLFWNSMRAKDYGLSRINSPNTVLRWEFSPSIEFTASPLFYSVKVRGKVEVQPNCEDEAEDAVEELKSEIKDIAESCLNDLSDRFTCADSGIHVNVSISIVYG